MPNTQKKKPFYPIDEVCDRLGLSLLDMAVLVSERKIRLSTAVPGLLVEDGHDPVLKLAVVLRRREREREREGRGGREELYNEYTTISFSSLFIYLSLLATFLC